MKWYRLYGGALKILGINDNVGTRTLKNETKPITGVRSRFMLIGLEIYSSCVRKIHDGCAYTCMSICTHRLPCLRNGIQTHSNPNMLHIQDCIHAFMVCAFTAACSPGYTSTQTYACTCRQKYMGFARMQFQNIYQNTQTGVRESLAHDLPTQAGHVNIRAPPPSCLPSAVHLPILPMPELCEAAARQTRTAACALCVLVCMCNACIVYAYA